MFTLFRLVAIAAIFLASACATSSNRQPEGAPVADFMAAAIDRPEYRVGPSDLLAVTVFQLQDLDREVRVNNLGHISLPLIGEVEAAGRTVTELEQDIAARYAARYLQDPQITVFVKDFASQRVTVGGAVKKPGIYPLTSRLTLLQALALAEGTAEVASLRNVVIFRNAGGKREFARFDVAAIQAGELADPELVGEDVVVVDTSSGKIALQNLIKLAPFLAVWRAYQ